MPEYNPKDGFKIIKKLLKDNPLSMSKEERQALNDFYFKIVEFSDKSKSLSDMYEDFEEYCKMRIKHSTMLEYLNDHKLKEDVMRIDELNYIPNKPNKPILAFTAEELKNRIKNRKDDKIANRYGNNSVFDSWMKNHKS